MPNGSEPSRVRVAEHVYGVLAIIGLIISVVTANWLPANVGTWLLIASGWAAAILVTVALVRISNDLSKRNGQLARRNERLVERTTELKTENEQLRNISGYLTSQIKPQTPIARQPGKKGRDQS